MIKILIADPIAKSAISSLQLLGAQISYAPELTGDDLPEAIQDAAILIVRSTRVTERTIAAAQDLALIVRAGAGVSTIDVNEATKAGVYVANCPGRNAAAVAELVIGLLIAVDRSIVQAAGDLQNGHWRKSAYPNGMGLAGNTLGILGLGAVGKAVSKAAAGLGMHAIAWSRSLTPKKASDHGVGFCATPHELAKRADVVSVHLAANANTYHFVDRRFLQQMRDGAYLINTSRGEIVDTAALKDAIYRKGLRVGLDVFEGEPASGIAQFGDRELAQMVVATPHIGASTRQAMEAISSEVVRVVGSFVSSGVPHNVINAPSQRHATRFEDGYAYAY